jgi:hypothetical protein
MNLWDRFSANHKDIEAQQRTESYRIQTLRSWRPLGLFYWTPIPLMTIGSHPRLIRWWNLESYTVLSRQKVPMLVHQHDGLQPMLLTAYTRKWKEKVKGVQGHGLSGVEPRHSPPDFCRNLTLQLSLYACRVHPE